MNNKRLAWNKENIEKSQMQIERMMSDSEEQRTLYGIIRAMLWAIGFILDEMHKGERNEQRS